MAAAFDRVFPMMGWDTWAAPKWQMVPAGGDRYVYLHDGAGLTVTSANPAVVAVTEVRDADLPAWWGKIAARAGDRIFRLRGGTKGNTRVEAKRGATTVAELEVDTKDKLTKRVSFKFLSDSASPPHQTFRPSAEAAQWVRTVNYIYQQCNVEIVSHAAAALTVPGDLGACVTWSSGAGSEWNTLRAYRDTGADVTVFQVWAYEQDGTEGTDNANAGRLGDMIIIEDHASTVHAHTVAHELAHFLGLPDLAGASQRHHLMYDASRTGQHISKGEVNTINP